MRQVDRPLPPSYKEGERILTIGSLSTFNSQLSTFTEAGSLGSLSLPDVSNTVTRYM